MPCTWCAVPATSFEYRKRSASFAPAGNARSARNPTSRPSSFVTPASSSPRLACASACRPPRWVSGRRKPCAGCRPARDLTTESLVQLFRAVADGSLDSGMIEDRHHCGDLEEAHRRLDQALSFDGEPDRFAVLVTGRDHETPAGYVVPALIDEMTVIAELGVAASHRGHGHGLKLLEHGVQVLSAADAEEIVADTDHANTIMRDVLARAGFVESEHYRTFH